MGVPSAALRAAAWAAALAIVVLGLGRVLGLPVFLTLVTSDTMVPTLHPLDAVLCLRRDFKVGDVVVWCAAPMYCAVHRVVEVRNNGNTVVTRGDASPVPDPPVPRNLVRGVVVLAVPRHVWVPLLLAPLVVYAASRALRRRRRLYHRGNPTGALELPVVYTVLVLLLALASPLSPVLLAGLSVPSAELLRAEFDRASGLVVVEYGPANANANTWRRLGNANARSSVEILSVDGCELSAANATVGCSALVSGSRVLVEVPRELLRAMNLEGMGSLFVRLNLSLPGGARLLTWSYRVHVPFDRLEVDVGGGLVSIRNPNPVCLDANVTVLWANRIGPWNVSSTILCLEPGEPLVLDLRHYRYAYVRIEYVLGGRLLLVQREVMRDGRPAS